MKVGPLLTESGPTILARTPKKAQVGLLFEEVGPLLAECDPTFSAVSVRKPEVGSDFANVTPLSTQERSYAGEIVRARATTQPRPTKP